VWRRFDTGTDDPLGVYWDDNVVARVMRNQKDNHRHHQERAHGRCGPPRWVRTRSALTRAQAAGVELAGELITRIDLTEARGRTRGAEGNDFRTNRAHSASRQQVQALGRDGAAAATRGDSAAVLAEIRKMLTA